MMVARILLLLSACLLPCLVAGAVDPSISTQLLWPMPSSVNVGDQVFSVDSTSFKITPAGANSGSNTLKQAISRYSDLMFKTPAPFYPSAANTTAAKALSELTITVSSTDEKLGLNTDESYSLTTSTGQLTANTVYGALRGLETFSQLVFRTQDGKYKISDVTISDAPRFKHRGSMIDTSRHYLQVQVIMDHLDAMSYNKFNVLHWHIVDDQSFPYVSTAYPDLSAMGAYDANHVYSPDDIKQIIEYAQMRGIRVIPEFDTPGHTQSWGRGQPSLLTPCYSNGKATGSYGPINPIPDSTWTFLKGLFSEVGQKVFMDDYIHLGGDEVSFGCWQSNPDIQKWMSTNNYTDYSKVEQYYETTLLQLIASLGKQYIVWQEIFDNGLKVLPDTVIHVWKGGSNWQKEMNSVTAGGLKTILSTCWYLNYISYGADWTKYYSCDPQDFNGTSAQNELVVGGEVCMWGEFVDTTNLLSRYWPRASAPGERLWSPQKYNDSSAAAPRLHLHTCRMLTRGIPAEPTQGPSFCSYEWMGKPSN